ncbi:MAG: hypothetical protein O6705_03790 [Actinobacteria bacterium]|nr:hypothetical protein [Actinomycetota bacterium]
MARFQAGEPVLAYTWSPSAYIAELIFGDDIVWMRLEQPLPEQVGAALMPPTHCPGRPCETGFVPPTSGLRQTPHSSTRTKVSWTSGSTRHGGQRRLRAHAHR